MKTPRARKTHLISISVFALHKEMKNNENPDADNYKKNPRNFH